MTAPGRVSLAAVTIAGRSDVDLELDPGERVAILGRNGAGKSTLVRVIAGLEAPARGVARIEGRVGYVAQSYRASLLPWLRAFDNVALGLREPKNQIASRVRTVVDRLPLDPSLLDRFPYELSGGEQQMIALARALVARPSILLLDEPFSALDVFARDAARDAVRSFVRASGATLILVTHDRGDLVLADRVLVLDRRLVEEGREARVA